VDSFATVALIGIAVVMAPALTMLAVDSIKASAKERAQGIDRNAARRARRRRRAKALRAADHAIEKQIDEVLPRAQARIHVDGDRK
jgi:hypothetical protein